MTQVKPRCKEAGFFVSASKTALPAGVELYYITPPPQHLFQHLLPLATEAFGVEAKLGGACL